MLHGRVGRFVEWPTFALMLVCYSFWALGTTVFANVHIALAIGVIALSIALYLSLQHEVIHCHPFRQKAANEVLVFPALNLVIPFARFRDTHLAHHKDAVLTDPYDDPESNFLDQGDWDRLPAFVRAALTWNNTLLGRILIGPGIAQVMFMRSEIRQARAGDRSVLRGWVQHFAGVTLVLFWLGFVGDIPLWAYCMAAYISLSIIKIRTFLEHQAHMLARGRTVIIEGHCPLSFLFLNNNLHAVHHAHPRVPWYRLPALFAANRDRYLNLNGGYYYQSYAEVFRRYFLRTKDPVAHPLWRTGQSGG